jgi:hypothetical protein
VGRSDFLFDLPIGPRARSGKGGFRAVSLPATRTHTHPVHPPLTQRRVDAARGGSPAWICARLAPGRQDGGEGARRRRAALFEAEPGRARRAGAGEVVSPPLALLRGAGAAAHRGQASRPTGRRNAGSAACRAPAKGRARPGRQRSSCGRCERRGRVWAMRRASWAAGPAWTPWARSAAAWRAATRSRTCSRAWRPARRPA